LLGGGGVSFSARGARGGGGGATDDKARRGGRKCEVGLVTIKPLAIILKVCSWKEHGERHRERGNRRNAGVVADMKSGELL